MTTERRIIDWAPEPWDYDLSDSSMDPNADAWLIQNEDGSIAEFEQEADADRTKQCVNALAGIADPTAYVQAVERLEAAVDELPHDSECNAYSDGACDCDNAAVTEALAAVRAAKGEVTS